MWPHLLNSSFADYIFAQVRFKKCVDTETLLLHQQLVSSIQTMPCPTSHAGCQLVVHQGIFLRQVTPVHLALALWLPVWGLISVSAYGRLCGLRLSIQHPANELTH